MANTNLSDEISYEGPLHPVARKRKDKLKGKRLPDSLRLSDDMPFKPTHPFEFATYTLRGTKFVAEPVIARKTENTLKKLEKKGFIVIDNESCDDPVKVVFDIFGNNHANVADRIAEQQTLFVVHELSAYTDLLEADQYALMVKKKALIERLISERKDLYILAHLKGIGFFRGCYVTDRYGSFTITSNKDEVVKMIAKGKKMFIQDEEGNGASYVKFVEPDLYSLSLRVIKRVERELFSNLVISDSSSVTTKKKAKKHIPV